MAWWDFGIHGRDGYGNLVKSGSISYPIAGFANLNNYIGCGSVSLPEATESGQTHRTLLCTTSGGTQVYLYMESVKTTGATVYNPTETVNLITWGMRIQLKKGGTTWEISSELNQLIGNTFIAGENSIYNYIKRSSANIYDSHQRIYSPNNAYPRSKSSGGATNQIGMVADSSGLSFFIVGFPCTVSLSPTYPSYSAPCGYIGRIPDSILNNPFWFDPEMDALSAEDYYDSVNGGGLSGDPTIDYDYTGTDIDFPSLPTGASAVGFGRMNIFNMTAENLAAALDILWSDSTESTLETIIESCKKWWYKPEQYCVALMLMPLNVTGTNKSVYFGKYQAAAGGSAISSQWQTVDCGSVSVPLKSGTAFDYSPYVQAMIFLPFVGFRSINTNEIMGGTAYVKYYVDMFTGSALCMVKISNTNSNSSVLYTYECNIATQIPITSENYNNVINSLITASASIGSAAITKTAAAAIGAASTTAGASQGLGSQEVQTSGKLTSNTGILGCEKPYIVLHFPVQAVPQGFANQNGYPSSVNINLGNISGYTEVEKIHLHIPNAYNKDLEMIENALKEGIVL